MSAATKLKVVNRLLAIINECVEEKAECGQRGCPGCKWNRKVELACRAAIKELAKG